MSIRPLCLLTLWATLLPPALSASDACSNRAVVAAADVAVSDGTSYGIETFFHSRDQAAFRQIGDRDQLVVVEGPFGWARSGDREALGENFYRVFALGHQFHAFILYFDEILDDPRAVEPGDVTGPHRVTASADYPFGGTVQVIGDRLRPEAMRFEFPETPPITAHFSDWRPVSDSMLPHRIRIDDGDREFDYAYSHLDISPRPPDWFRKAIPAPGIDEIQVYRLHRDLLTAHCLGDAETMARLSAPELLVASRGALTEDSNRAMLDRFSVLFERLDYLEYHDLVEPRITLSASADIGWVGINARTVGRVTGTDRVFDDQWAWIMMVEKIDGRWLHRGNASNRLE